MFCFTGKTSSKSPERCRHSVCTSVWVQLFVLMKPLWNIWSALHSFLVNILSKHLNSHGNMSVIWHLVELKTDFLFLLFFVFFGESRQKVEDFFVPSMLPANCTPWLPHLLSEEFAQTLLLGTTCWSLSEAAGLSLTCRSKSRVSSNLVNLF